MEYCCELSHKGVVVSLSADDRDTVSSLLLSPSDLV